MSGRAHRPALVVSLLAMAAATTLCASPAAAGRASVAVDAVRLYIDDQSYAIEPGDAFEATIRVEGSDALAAALTGAEAVAVVSVHEAITSPDQLDLSVDVEVHGPKLDSVGPVAVGGVDALTSTIAVPIGIGTSEPGSLVVDGSGIHPITIELSAGSSRAAATTFVEVLDPAAPAQPLSIAIATAVADSDSLSDLVDVAATIEAPLSVSLTPAVAVGLDGQSGPAALSPDALRLDELVALPAAPLDPSAVVAVDESSAFTRMLREGEDQLSAASPLAVVSRAVWIADRSISRPAAAMLRDLGVRLLVMTDDVADGIGVDPEVTAFAVSLGDGDTLPAMRIDPLGAALAADMAPSAQSANQRAVRLLAGLRLARRGGAAPGVVLAAPGLAVPDGEVTARLAGLVGDLPDTSIVALSRLPGFGVGGAANGATAIALPAVAGADLGVRQADIAAAHEDANHAASMLVDSPLPDVWGGRLDALLASDLDDATVAARLAEINAEIDSVLSAIVPPEPFTFTLTGTTNTLRLPIRNTAAEPLLVDVRIRSPKLTTDQPTNQVEVPALSSVEVEVPVEARSQGTFTIEVDVLAPDGHRLGPPVVLKGRVSQLSGLSQVVTGGAALVLVSWWYTHLRRRRADRRAQRAMIQP